MSFTERRDVVIAPRRSPVRVRLAPLTDRSPLGFVEHDDFDRFRVSNPWRLWATPAKPASPGDGDLQDLTRLLPRCAANRRGGPARDGDQLALSRAPRP